MSIELPKYEWFVNSQGTSYVTNRYSGSCGTSPSSGCLSVTTFNYRVFIETIDSKIKIIAEYFLILPWSKGSNIENLTRAEFDNSQYGVEKAAEWLSEESHKYNFGSPSKQ